MPTPNTTDLKKFAQKARRQLLEQVAGRLEQVLRTDSPELREKEFAVKELYKQIAQSSKAQVIDQVAYTWFNRFCALRFMDMNRYTRMGVVSPAQGATQPEILQEAKQGYIDEEIFPDARKRQGIFDLLNGQRPASDPQGEAYRLLLVGVCNSYSEVMPFLFEKIEDYTELLMPLDLLSENSVLHDLREALSPEACEDVEVIGWLYQYYISERKDKVFEALKQNQKIEAGDIPAATQLFTPHWIVRYLVENSLGRLWMLNHPNSGLREKMEYYIAPAQDESDFLRIASPEELRLLDPACGSGHILTYAFDLLAAIYEEEGYASSDVAKLILEKNLFGVEIDPRAGALAAFALVMKARAKDRRFFTRTAARGEPVEPNICVLENVTFNDAELKQYMNAVGRDLFTEPLMETLRQFEQADNFGSLIRPMLTDAGYVRGLLEGKNLGGDLFLFGVHERVLKVLKQAEFLAPHYHVVVANPPYMGSSGMNNELKEFSESYYPDSKADLFAMFIERNLDLLHLQGYIGMITMQSWMFLSSFEKIREKVLQEYSIISLAHLGTRAFDTIGGAVVSTVAFVLQNTYLTNFRGAYLRLIDGKNETEKDLAMREAINNPNCGWFYRSASSDFKKIPDSPIAYWASDQVKNIFSTQPLLSTYCNTRKGMATGLNDEFVRVWTEVSYAKLGFGFSRSDAAKSTKKWFPYANGGSFRKWYGNYIDVVNWEKDGYRLQTEKHESGRIRAVNLNLDYIFRDGLSWTSISSSINAFRVLPKGFLFSSASNALFSDSDVLVFLSLLNSKIFSYVNSIMNPTLNANPGDIGKVPFIQSLTQDYKKEIPIKCVELSKMDWDSFEISWDFKSSPLLEADVKKSTVSETYQCLSEKWQKITTELQRLEKNNNRLLFESYGLNDELTPDVPVEEITLNCNPFYRYDSNKSVEELDEFLRGDTMREFISYAVGCMFGRYSLDTPGLVLANQGETLKDYLKQVPKPTFTPDEDNVIPVLEGEWFEDDIAERFKKFLRVTFGEKHYDENLAFIEESIGRDVRSYFVKEFYKDHVQTYKKRPIYWMFSSPKGSFQALIYMHRYKPDTLSVVLKYLRDYREKLTARKAFQEQLSISGSASAREKTAALKEIEKLNATLEELRVYERESLYPLATQQVAIDLDDGVKVNYPKFGAALVKIVGL